MSWNEYLQQKYYDEMKMKELQEEKAEVEKHLEILNFKIAELVGNKVKQVSGIGILDESTKCINCNMISSLVYSQLCYHCYGKKG